MKNLLLDSHELIWILYEPEKINKKTKDFIGVASLVYISIASIWELAVKHYNGKLAYSPEEFLGEIERAGIKIIQIEPSHILELNNANFKNKDPFDRMLLAQAKAEGFCFLTADSEIIKMGMGYVVPAKDL